MIVESRMTGEELLKNFHKDRKIIANFVNDVIDKNISKIRRALKIKKQDFVKLRTRSILIGDTRYYVVVKVFLSSNRIRWFGKFYNISLNKSGKKVLIHYALNESPLSLHVKNILKDSESRDWSVYIYENHLLNRFRERYLGLDPGEINFEDLAEKFMNKDEDFLNSTTSLSNPDEEVKKGSRLEMRKKDGIYFGVLEDPKKFRYITYITPEMATREGQDFIRDEAIKELEENYEEIRYLSDIKGKI